MIENDGPSSSSYDNLIFALHSFPKAYITDTVSKFECTGLEKNYGPPMPWDFLSLVLVCNLSCRSPVHFHIFSLPLVFPHVDALSSVVDGSIYVNPLPGYSLSS